MIIQHDECCTQNTDRDKNKRTGNMTGQEIRALRQLSLRYYKLVYYYILTPVYSYHLVKVLCSDTFAKCSGSARPAVAKERRLH